MSRLLPWPAMLLAVIAVAGCAAGPGPRRATHPSASPAAPPASARPAASASSPPAVPASALPPDPPTAAALLRIAQVFNNEYDNGDFGAVYTRWDPRSQAIISRASYIQRHLACAPATHETAVVEGASRAGGGAWHVRYEIGGEQLVDTWYYLGHRWLFDILLSNPGAAADYRLPFARYAAAVGCTLH